MEAVAPVRPGSTFKTQRKFSLCFQNPWKTLQPPPKFTWKYWFQTKNSTTCLGLKIMGPPLFIIMQTNKYLNICITKTISQTLFQFHYNKKSNWLDVSSYLMIKKNIIKLMVKTEILLIICSIKIGETVTNFWQTFLFSSLDPNCIKWTSGRYRSCPVSHLIGFHFWKETASCLRLLFVLCTILCVKNTTACVSCGTKPFLTLAFLNFKLFFTLSYKSSKWSDMYTKIQSLADFIVHWNTFYKLGFMHPLHAYRFGRRKKGKPSPLVCSSI